MSQECLQCKTEFEEDTAIYMFDLSKLHLFKNIGSSSLSGLLIHLPII